jgi:hypothetical protein
MEPGLKIDVRRRIIVNGKEYGSVDELPPTLRNAYEQAMRRPPGVGAAGPAKTRIRLNGQEYDGVEALPPDLRQLYQDALRTVQGEALGQQAAATSGDVLPSGSSISGRPNDTVLSSTANQTDSTARLPRTALTYGALAVMIALAVYLRFRT